MPLSDNEMDALKASQNKDVLTDAQMDAMKSDHSESLAQKALGYVGTGIKALNSVTADPTRSAIYAIQNKQNPIYAAANQFGNMSDAAPTGEDIAVKAGFSPKQSPQYVSDVYKNIPGVPQQKDLPMMASPAKAAGRFIEAAANPLNFIGPALSKSGEVLSGITESLAPKAGAEAIKAASSRLGFKPTPGMISESGMVGNLENSMSHSASPGGALTRKAMEPISKGLQGAASDIVSGSSSVHPSAYLSGDEAAKGILSSVGEKVTNVRDAYEPFNQELHKMVPDKLSQHELADKIYNISQQHLDPNEVDSLTTGITNKIMNSKSLADIEETRKLIGNKLAQEHGQVSPDTNLIDTLSKMKDKLSDYRDEQFQTLAKQSYPGPGGKAIGDRMVEEYKAAMASHHSLMNDLRDIGPVFGIKAQSPRDFVESFSQIPAEKIASKLFQANDFRNIQKVQTYFPEEFDKIRQFKLQELRNASLENPLDHANSAVDPVKLIKNINKIKSPEIRTILLGDKAGKYSDMQTVLGSMPKEINPSGTSHAEGLRHWVNPVYQGMEGARYAGYRALGSDAASQIPEVGANISKKASEIVPKVSPVASVITPNFVRNIETALPAAADENNPGNKPSRSPTNQ